MGVHESYGQILILRIRVGFSLRFKYIHVDREIIFT